MAMQDGDDDKIEPKYADFDLYQTRSKTTAIYRNVGSNYIYPVLGLASEAGEVADRVKRIDRDDHGVVTDLKRAEVAGELGDVLWYAAQVASEFGLSLADIARENIEKLQGRQSHGTLGGYGNR